MNRRITSCITFPIFSYRCPNLTPLLMGSIDECQDVTVYIEMNTHLQAFTNYALCALQSNFQLFKQLIAAKRIAFVVCPFLSKRAFVILLP